MDWAPWTMDTSTLTAPTPITIPSIVSAVRSLLRPSARNATLRMANRFIFIALLVFGFRRHLPQNFSSVLPVFNLDISPDAAVPELNHAAGMLRNIRLVSHCDEDEIPLAIQSVKDLHDFSRR